MAIFNSYVSLPEGTHHCRASHFQHLVAERGDLPRRCLALGTPDLHFDHRDLEGFQCKSHGVNGDKKCRYHVDTMWISLLKYYIYDF